MIVSIAMLGAFFSCLVSGALCDKFGRKPVIIVADILFSIGSILMAFAATPTTLMVGRFVIGLAIGTSSIVVPIYLSEISPNASRGTIVGVNSTMCPIGQFISSLIALALRGNWRLMLGLAAVPSTLQLIGMFFLPES